MPRKLALLIGNSNYEDLSLSRLMKPIADVRGLVDVLVNPDIGNFEIEDVLINENDSKIKIAIEKFFKRKKSDDLLLLYYAGHGVLDEQGRLYLAAPNTQRYLLKSTAIPTDFIAGEMQESDSKEQILILDCCHSGAFIRGVRAAVGTPVNTRKVFSNRRKGYGRVIMTAADSTQFALEGSESREISNSPNSIFTHFLIQGVRTGQADLDGDGEITHDELFEYSYNMVKDVTRLQTPKMWVFDYEGKISLAKTFVENPQKTPSETLRLLIQDGLDESTVSLLLKLDVTETSARVQAVKELAKLGRTDQPILEALRYVMRSDSEPSVRFSARNALLVLGRASELNMIIITAGKFLMGTSEEQRTYLSRRYGFVQHWTASEIPQQTVDLPEYFIDRTPVTNANFAEFVKATGYQTTGELLRTGWVKLGHRGGLVEVSGVNWAHPRGPGSTWEEIPDHPVVLLSWHDTVAYAEWVGKRLPTEAEWEKAARGTDGRIWPWGNEWEEGHCNSASYHATRPLRNEDEWQFWWASFDQARYGAPTTPVHAFSQGASPYGVLDCVGNVCERTADWYQPYPGTEYQSEQFGENFHVLRGGSWIHNLTLARVASRDFAHPSYRTVHDGFRCVLSAPIIG